MLAGLPVVKFFTSNSPTLQTLRPTADVLDLTNTPLAPLSPIIGASAHIVALNRPNDITSQAKT